MTRRYLLDTHLVIWRLRGDLGRLGTATRGLIANSDCCLSVVSLFEMLAKNAAGKLPLPEGSLSQRLSERGLRVLPLTAEHVESGMALPGLHPDPNDCLLLGVARSERVPLLTRDGPLLEAAKPLLGDLIVEA